MQVLLAALWIIESLDAVNVYVMNWFVMYETPNSMSIGVISKSTCGWYKDSSTEYRDKVISYWDKLRKKS